MLSKKDNKVAEALIVLNSYAYYEDSLRNITLRKDKVMSFCPANKPTVITTNEDGCNGVWSKENRQEGKYGKVLKKVLNEQAPRFEYIDKDLEELVNFLKAEVSDGKFRIVSGEDIRYWYHEDRYKEGQGSLDGSCMRHDGCQDYFDIYVENDDVVEMVILVKNDQLIGRALLWKGKWMDRIYGSDETIEKFKVYASQNGYNVKYRQSYDDKEQWVSPEGNEFHEHVHIHLSTEWDSYPYMDTFAFMDDGVISNERGSEYNLSDTGGCRDEGERECARSGHWYCNSDMREIDGEWYYYEYCVIDELAVPRDYILQDNSVTLYDGRVTHEHNDAIVTVDGHGVFHIDDAVHTTDERLIRRVDMVTCEHSENIYHKDDPMKFLEAIGITVHEDFEDEAYGAHGYVHDEEKGWIEKAA
jgi:hypothetical protein